MSETLPMASPQYRAAHVFAFTAAAAHAAAIGAAEASEPHHARYFRVAAEAAERLHTHALARFNAIKADEDSEAVPDDRHALVAQAATGLS